jgi:hypothetical protein
MTNDARDTLRAMIDDAANQLYAARRARASVRAAGRTILAESRL